MTREPQALLMTFAARLEEARAYLPPDAPFDRLIGLQGEVSEPHTAQNSEDELDLLDNSFSDFDELGDEGEGRDGSQVRTGVGGRRELGLGAALERGIFAGGRSARPPSVGAPQALGCIARCSVAIEIALGSVRVIGAPRIGEATSFRPPAAGFPWTLEQGTTAWRAENTRAGNRESPRRSG